MTQPLFAADALVDWTADILRGTGVPAEAARVAAEVLIDANLTGVDTHGLGRLKPYLALLQGGHVNATPRFACETKNGALVFDADRGLGQVACREAVRLAVEEARSRAVVGMTLARVGHLGALGHFTGQAAEAGMIALLVQNGPPIMAPAGSTRPAIGNNPLAFSAPVPGGPPIVFDIATSEAAFGKVIEAARAGRPIPAGWAVDKDGRPTTEAKAALTGSLLPAGGHKGIGISMLVEVLAGGLTGMVPRKVQPGGKGMPAYFGGFLLVVNPDLLIGRSAFEAHLSDWLDHYRASAPGDGGSSGNRYPGQSSAAIRERRRTGGVPLGEELAGELRALGEARGVPFPAAL